MRDLIEVSQREYAQIINFEHRKLAMSTEEKRAMLAQLAASEVGIVSLLRDCAVTLKLDSPEPSAAQVAEALEGELRHDLMEKVTCLRSLTQSFRELQGVCQYHAERGLTVVRSYSALLRGQDPAVHETADSYTQTGRVLRASLPSQTVSRNA